MSNASAKSRLMVARAVRAMMGTIKATTAGPAVWAKKSSSNSMSDTAVLTRSPVRLLASFAGARGSMAQKNSSLKSTRMRNAAT